MKRAQIPHWQIHSGRIPSVSGYAFNASLGCDFLLVKRQPAETRKSPPERPIHLTGPSGPSVAKRRLVPILPILRARESSSAVRLETSKQLPGSMMGLVEGKGISGRIGRGGRMAGPKFGFTQVAEEIGRGPIAHHGRFKASCGVFVTSQCHVGESRHVKDLLRLLAG